jgi:hypothetical protein
VRPEASKSPAGFGPSQNPASPGSLPTGWPILSPSVTASCPGGASPAKESHAPGR